MSLLEDRLVRIMELRSTGKDERAIAEALEITPAMVVNYEKSLESSLWEYVGGKKSIGKMAAALQISPLLYRTVLVYFGISYPLSLYRQQQKQLKDRLHRHQQSFSLPEARMEQLRGQQGFAYRKAMDYIRLHPQTPIPDSQLVSLFVTYEFCQKKNIKLSLEELGGEIKRERVGKILREVGLEPLHGTRKVTRTPMEKKAAIVRALQLNLGVSDLDLAYFLDLPIYTIENIRRWRKIPTRDHVKPLKKFGKNGEFLTYRLPSQIYEVNDAGYTTEEIAELLKMPVETIRYALRQRGEIAPVIERTLRVLYPHEKIERPYRTQK